MVKYLVYRIKIEALNYTDVVAKYPQNKADIDSKLIADGFQHLIVE